MCTYEQRGNKTSTLPPPCYHSKPMPCYQKYECQSECPRMNCCCCPGEFKCRPKPKRSIVQPTIYCEKTCPPCERPPPCTSVKLKPPPSCVRYCISTTCGKTTYAPCYYSNAPVCPPSSCC